MKNQIKQTLYNGNKLLNKFWVRFNKEYLTSLKTINNAKNTANFPKIGQNVLLKEDLNLNKWKCAKIIKLNESDDGNIQSAQIQMENGRKSIRPVSKLIPLELDFDHPV